jgi:hypothetical protein
MGVNSLHVVLGSQLIRQKLGIFFLIGVDSFFPSFCIGMVGENWKVSPTQKFFSLLSNGSLKMQPMC